MNDLIHADIFFFVTTIAVVVVALFFTVTLIYLILILKRVRDVMDEVKKETILIREDIHSFRDQVKSGGAQIKYVTQFLQSIFTGKKTKVDKK